MMLTLQRKPSVDGATIGELLLDGIRMVYTLEDEIREVPGRPVEEWKIHGETAIPVGRYRITLESSPKFGPDTLTVWNVPGFDGVRMHAGNTAEDTEGCPLLGLRVTDDQIVGGTSRSAVLLVQGQVRRAIEQGDKVFMDVVNPPAQ